MRRKQWFLSVVLFAGSLCFLVFSKSFFSTPSVSQSSSISLPGTSTAQANLVLLANKDYYPFLKQHFQTAQRKILGTIYLVKTAPYRDNEPSDLLRELMAAQKRNVAVELIIDVTAEDKDANESNLRAYEILKKAGVHVQLDRSDIATHAKAFVIDDRYCFVGSHNLTHSAMTTNEELSLFIDSPEMAQKISDFVHQIPLAEGKVEKRARREEGKELEKTEE